jgi:hypothetical protein
MSRILELKAMGIVQDMGQIAIIRQGVDIRWTAMAILILAVTIQEGDRRRTASPVEVASMGRGAVDLHQEMDMASIMFVRMTIQVTKMTRPTAVAAAAAAAVAAAAAATEIPMPKEADILQTIPPVRVRVLEWHTTREDLRWLDQIHAKQGMGAGTNLQNYPGPRRTLSSVRYRTLGDRY